MHPCNPIGRALLLALLASAHPSAQATDHDFALDPKTYASPSGEVTLFVEPSHPSGGGPATYRCMRGERELWSGTRPYTLWQAVVGDDGLVAGYAYGAGHRGGPRDALTIALIAPDGKARLEESSKRTGMVGHLGMPDPMVAGLFLDPDNERLVVRARTGNRATEESWWTYALADGTPGPRLDPSLGSSDERMRAIDEALAVPGTGLTLVRWEQLDLGASRFGAVFLLLDPEGRSVWRLAWPEDYPFHGPHRAILAVAPRGFTLHQVATSERVTFEIEPATDARKGWQVREVARAPFATEAQGPKAEPPAVKELALARLGSIELGTRPPQRTIRDVRAFALDDLGRPGFLRGSEERHDFVRVERDGGNAIEIPLPGPPEGEWWQYALAWTEGERWLVTASGSPSRAWWLDVARRSTTAIDGLAELDVQSVAGTPDGGFVVLGTSRSGSGIVTSELVAFDREGRRRFALGGNQGPEEPASLFSPVAVTALGSGGIVVLGGVRGSLQFFTATGQFERRVELEKAWGRKPNYLTGLHADVDGGLLVHDFKGDPPIVRVDTAGNPSGKLRSGFEPHYADGRAFRPRGDVQASRDGTLWSSDGDALLVLDGEGVVQRVLGAAPEATTLGEIGALALGPGDCLYAADERTGAVHVFGPDGTLRNICRTAPSDFTDGLALTPLTVTDAGEVYLGEVHFRADGARIEKTEPRIDRIAQKRHAQHGSERIWVVGYRALYLVERDGSVVRKIERAPDGTWLRDLDQAAVAPDGSIVLGTSDLDGARSALHLYSARGEPVRSLPSPRGRVSWAGFAFDGARLAIGIEQTRRPGSVVLMDAHGQTLGRLTPEGEVPFWQPHFAAGGKELWLFDGERRVERYALP